MRRSMAIIAGLVVVLAACSKGTTPTAAPSASGSNATCDKASLNLYQPGQLTVATDSPSYPPWIISNTPSNGKGFESAVAYAVAQQLGFSQSEVKWVVQPFNTSYAPGPKHFDFDINQITITPERAQVVTFSDGYFVDHQALVAVKGTPLAGATSMAQVKTAKLGVQAGTTSLSYIAQYIQPTQQPAVFDNTNDAISALNVGRIDGIVVDVPTAVYMASAQVKNGVVVGQFPPSNPPEEFGMLFQKGNPLVTCVNQALATLKSDGTLAQLQSTWIPAKYTPPTIAP